MTPHHLEVLISARSHLVALARGRDDDVYDDLLAALDDLHPELDATPIRVPVGEDRAGWYASAADALGELARHGVHELSGAVLLARLHQAWARDAATGCAR